MGKNFEKAKSLEELGTGTNFEHAKYAQKWCRTLPSWLSSNNVILNMASLIYDPEEVINLPLNNSIIPNIDW